jgi:hypothetical protein
VGDSHPFRSCFPPIWVTVPDDPDPSSQDDCQSFALLDRTARNSLREESAECGVHNQTGWIPREARIAGAGACAIAAPVNFA